MQSLFPRLIAIFSPIFLLIQYMDASDMQSSPNEAQSLDATDANLVQRYDQDVEDAVSAEDVESVDEWYGPGYYYGFWFGNEPDYWRWRRTHRDYPPNRNYYHPTHPVHYDHRNRGGSREQNFF